jgi:hypothetical protein
MRFHFCAHCVQLFLAGVAIICLAAGKHLLDHFFITIHTLHLVKRAFVVIQPHPVHAVENRLYRFRGGALQICVFDTQNEGAAMFAGISPGEQGGAHATNVQIAGRAGGKTGTNGHWLMIQSKNAYFNRKRRVVPWQIKPAGRPAW